jgi:hypothetical protein
VCAGALEWRVDIIRHISVGKTSVREAAHCPSCHGISLHFTRHVLVQQYAP